MLLFSVTATAARLPDDRDPVVVSGVEDSDVFALGRSLIVQGIVRKGAMALGGDVVVKGTVEGDVAAFGGSVIQEDGARINGDVFVFGGTYQHGMKDPLRNPASMTFMYAGYEQEIRRVMRNPLDLLAPNFSPVSLGMRVLGVLFWFVASLAFTAATPGAVRRAVARLQLTQLRIVLIGFCSAVIIFLGVPIAMRFLPTVFGALLGLTSFLLLMLSYLFGRVAIHASTGLWLQRRFFSRWKNSESVTLLFGTIFWTVALSLPYLWPLVIAGLVVASLGIALTARTQILWSRPEV